MRARLCHQSTDGRSNTMVLVFGPHVPSNMSDAMCVHTSNQLPQTVHAGCWAALTSRQDPEVAVASIMPQTLHA